MALTAHESMVYNALSDSFQQVSELFLSPSHMITFQCDHLSIQKHNCMIHKCSILIEAGKTR
jgi:hypothetical protein